MVLPHDLPHMIVIATPPAATSAVAFVAAILQKLIGAAGTLLTIIVILVFGNPSSGGATGVPYLPTFWRDLGPYLPPRNAYILLHQTIYFSGHGTTRALTVLLIYLGVGAVILGVLDWRRSEPRCPPMPPRPRPWQFPLEPRHKRLG